MEKTVIELDVRDDIKFKLKPFNKIMNAISSFQGNDILILHVPFKPIPLLKVMEDRGFMHEIELVSTNHLKVTFTKKGIEESTTDFYENL